MHTHTHTNERKIQNDTMAVTTDCLGFWWITVRTQTRSGERIRHGFPRELRVLLIWCAVVRIGWRGRDPVNGTQT